MKLKEKREIVLSIIDTSNDIYEVVAVACKHAHPRNKALCDWDDDCDVLLEILRDYINGKFTLEPKGKRKP